MCRQVVQVLLRKQSNKRVVRIVYRRSRVCSGVNRIAGGAVKCDDLCRNVRGEGDSLGDTDVETRKCRERSGLETRVVYTVKDVYYWLKKD